MGDDDREYIEVHLTRRTLPEQVDWLILQVSFLVAKVNRLEREAESLAALNRRLTAVERAIPLQRPKSNPPNLPRRQHTPPDDIGTRLWSLEEIQDQLRRLAQGPPFDYPEQPRPPHPEA